MYLDCLPSMACSSAVKDFLHSWNSSTKAWRATRPARAGAAACECRKPVLLLLPTDESKTAAAPATSKDGSTEADCLDGRNPAILALYGVYRVTSIRHTHQQRPRHYNVKTCQTA
mmetsp:Transcript_36580/g.85723  ORF Transcript_36580/g.85723 Transcript_36580/m.85723 type:complete len:115 (-) Transcript_36580:38-382(-)